MENFLLLYQLLNDCDWSDVLSSDYVNVGVNAFYNLMYNSVDASIPKYKVKRTTQSNRYPSWPSINLIRKLRKKIVT